MRTTIEIDDDPMAEALKVSGLPLLVRTRRQGRIRRLRGGLNWESSLDEMRRDR